ncbi:MAG TPA: alkaline phosphatase family protein [Chloroflexota bacterium]
MRLTVRGTLAAIKAGATLRRLQLPFSQIEGRRRGFVILQIDALSHDDLVRAMDEGHLPFLERLVGSSHRLSRWRSGAPSDTAAIQCAMMYGKKSNVPGFYWFDRRKQRPVICSWPLDMASVERENADGSAGLFRHGSVYMGMAAGGAQRAVFTTSALGRTTFPPKLTGIDVLLLLVLNPWRLLRAALLTVAEVVIEMYEQVTYRLRGRYVAPEGIFPLTRAFTHVLFRELTTLGIRLDIFRGVPAIYANYIGYDEIAHHLGPRSSAAYKSLRALDRQIRDVHKAIKTIGLRPYDLYIMSDHGMTESLPFHHLYGQTLGQFIAQHGVTPPRASELDTRGYKDRATLQHLEELSAEIGPRTSSATGFFVDRIMRIAMRIGTGPLQAGLAEDSRNPVLAIYSSALANVYFTQTAERADRDRIEELAPGLLASLVSHPGIGLVIVKSEGRTVVLHAGGSVCLEDADDEELSFLALYDEPCIVRPQLLALANMPSAGDLLVFGAYDGKRVVNFEDHGGAHGGLGGVQMFPFMASPVSVEAVFDNMTDATELHPFFVRRYQFASRGLVVSSQSGADSDDISTGIAAAG